MCMILSRQKRPRTAPVGEERVADRKKSRCWDADRRRIDRTFSLFPGDWHYVRPGPVFWLAVDLPRAFPCTSTVAYCGVVRLTAAGRCAGLAEQSASPASRFTRPTEVELGTQNAASIRRTPFATNSFLKAARAAPSPGCRGRRRRRRRSHQRRPRLGCLGSYFHPGTMNCIAIASSRAPLPRLL